MDTQTTERIAGAPAAPAAASSPAAAAAAAVAVSPYVGSSAACGDTPNAHKRKETDALAEEESFEKRQKIAAAAQATKLLAAGWRHPRWWPDLTLDYVESITQWLQLKEVSTLHRTCAGWRATTSKLRRGSATVRLRGAHLPLLHAAPYRGTVAALKLMDGNEAQGESVEAVTQSELAPIAETLPQLSSLSVLLKLTVPRPTVSRLFGALQVLEIDVELGAVASTPETCWPALETLVHDIARIPALRSFTLRAFSSTSDLEWMANEPLPARVLQPLTSLRLSLTSLTIRCPWAQPLLPEHIAVFRTLSLLTSLHIWFAQHDWTPSALDQLTAEPTPPTLERLELGRLTDNHIPALLRLATLTELAPAWMEVSDFSFLASLPRLRRLGLNQRGLTNQLITACLPSLLTALAACSTIDELTLSGNGRAVTEILHRLPRLRRLDCSIGTLAFLPHVPHLSETLEELVVHADGIPISHVLHLRCLRRLRRLSIHGFFEPPQAVGLVERLFDLEDTHFDRMHWPHLEKVDMIQTW